MGNCQIMVPEPPGFWHEHMCGKPAKFVLVGVGTDRREVCGIHANMLERDGWKRDKA